MIPLTNCKNCGAPLHGTVCEFCGTVYNDDQYLELRKNLQDELRLLSLNLSVRNQVQAIMSQNVYNVEVPKAIAQKDFIPSIKVNSNKYLIQIALPADTKLPAVYEMVIKESKENSNILQVIVNRTA